MAQTDSIAVVFDEAELKQVKDAIAVLNATLMPKLKTLSAQDKKELPKMGDRSAAFVQKAFEYSQKHEGLRPAWLDVSAFAVDVNAVATLRQLSHDVQPLVDALDDSLALSGSEAYQAALMFYGNVRSAAKLNVKSAQGVYDDLAARFPGNPTLGKAATTR